MVVGEPLGYVSPHEVGLGKSVQQHDRAAAATYTHNHLRRPDPGSLATGESTVAERRMWHALVTVSTDPVTALLDAAPARPARHQFGTRRPLPVPEM